MSSSIWLQVINFFLIYAFLGWVVEVVYHVVAQGTIVNRGFLNGPVCPIYGFGMLLILYLLLPVSDNLLVLFLGGMFLTTSIELFGGWALEKLFHMRWWDYSHEHFNLKGYICLKFSLAWGIGVVCAVRVIHTIVNDVSSFVLRTPLKYILIPLTLLLLADLAATIATILNMQKELRNLDHLAKEMREFSDSLTERIGNRTLEAEQKIDESRVQMALGKAEFRQHAAELRRQSEAHRIHIEQELANKRRQIEKIQRRLYANKWYGTGRIMDAYPHAILVRRNQKLKEFVEKHTKD